MTRFAGVAFDLGGVVLESPFPALAELERTAGAVPGTIAAVIVASGPGGAWARYECGLIDRAEFVRSFDAELVGTGVRAPDVLDAIDRAPSPRPKMLAAVARIREAGLATAAITNTWRREDGTTAATAVAGCFDVVVESAVEGVHKPDAAMFRRALDRLGLPASAVVFLDDIGRNLKVARSLGFHTIRVDDPDDALRELGDLLDLPLG